MHLVLSIKQPDALINEIKSTAESVSNSDRDDLLPSLDWHSSNRRAELPLIGMRIEVGVDEHAVARLARRKL
jgi:hypothetical protein